MNRIGVGIIGASPLNPGWGVTAHIPALQRLPQYELRAVSTSNAVSAAAAANAFEVAALDNHTDLIAHSGVDLVVVTVKVSNHHELVTAALDAGKIVFCEWPLGRNSDEAHDLAVHARLARVHNAIGLQARFAPTICYARDLIADGYIGDTLATTLVGSGLAWGPTTDRGHAYAYDVTNGATVLSVSALHALDALAFMLGDFAVISAQLATRGSEVQLLDAGAKIPVTAPDHAAILGTLSSGAVFSVFYRGGRSRGDNLHWEINGSDGDLVLTAAHGNVQAADLSLRGGRHGEAAINDLVIPARYFDLLPGISQGPPLNVGLLYAQFARDIHEGTRVTPDFAHAMARHRLLDAMETAARTGTAWRAAT